MGFAIECWNLFFPSDIPPSSNSSYKIWLASTTARELKVSLSDLQFMRRALPETVEPAFFQYLGTLDCSEVKVFAIKEGSVVFPKVPLVTVEGPLAVCQLLETTFLNLVNYSSLVATNASRFRNV